MLKYLHLIAVFLLASSLACSCAEDEDEEYFSSQALVDTFWCSEELSPLLGTGGYIAMCYIDFQTQDSCLISEYCERENWRGTITYSVSYTRKSNQIVFSYDGYDYSTNPARRLIGDFATGTIRSKQEMTYSRNGNSFLMENVK